MTTVSEPSVTTRSCNGCWATYLGGVMTAATWHRFEDVDLPAET
jgi:hypothetical protein